MVFASLATATTARAGRVRRKRVNSTQIFVHLSIEMTTSYELQGVVVTVQHLDQSGAPVRTYTLNNCFVSDISAIDLSYDSTDAISEFTVTWVYDYFTV